MCKGKDIEKRNIYLSKQASDFEKIVVVERRRFAKEREEHEKEVLDCLTPDSARKHREIDRESYVYFII